MIDTKKIAETMRQCSQEALNPENAKSGYQKAVFQRSQLEIGKVADALDSGEMSIEDAISMCLVHALGKASEVLVAQEMMT